MESLKYPTYQLSDYFDTILVVLFEHSYYAIFTTTSKMASTENDTIFITKTPKGTQDFYGKSCKIRNNIMNNVRLLFELFGSQELDTPVFELRETLNGKYGEEGKQLIYNLEDQGGEKLSLRYDLTVPMCRYVAEHKLSRFIRHQLQKVYRRDNPRMTLGRFREFYQCDLDIAGSYSRMIVDAEVFTILGLILHSLGLSCLFDVTIKVNHRKILDGVFRSCGVDESSIRAVSSAIDKLDKIPWVSDDPSVATVRKELINDKGISEHVADAIGKWTCMSGTGVDFLNSILQMDGINDEIKSGVEDLMLLEGFLKDDPVHPLVRYDLSLARGLDYYTGTIFEAVISDVPGVGTFAAGGRYDELVKLLSNDKVNTPCVGMSLGLERVAAILNSALSEDEVLVAAKIESDGAKTEEQKQLLEKYQTFQKTLPIRKLVLKNFKSTNVKPFIDSGKTAQVCIIRCDDSPEVLKYARKVANMIRRDLKTSVQYRMTDKARTPTDQITEFVKEHESEVAVFVSQKGLNRVVNVKQLSTKTQKMDVSLSDMCDAIEAFLQ